MGAQGSSILLLRSAPAPRGNAAMTITFATLLANCGVPNGNGLTESSAIGSWTNKFNRNAGVIDFDQLRTTGWGTGSCNGGCGSAGCSNNFCSALGNPAYL